MEKVENAGYATGFSPYPEIFLKLFCKGHQNSGLCGE